MSKEEALKKYEECLKRDNFLARQKREYIKTHCSTEGLELMIKDASLKTEYAHAKLTKERHDYNMKNYLIEKEEELSEEIKKENEDTDREIDNRCEDKFLKENKTR